MTNTHFLLILALAFGLIQNQNKIKHWIKPLPALTPGSYKVVLYSTTWCGYCAKTRAYFNENKIVFQEIDVEKTTEGRQAYQEFGANGVPIIVINEKSIIRGFDPDDIDAALRGEQI